MSVLFISGAAMASPPIPPRKMDAEQLQIQLDAQKKHKAELEAKAKSIGKELNSARDDLVKAGKRVQDNEKTLLELEDQIENLEQEKADLEKAFEEDQKSLSRLVLALQRISRVPPQALIAKPDAPLQTAQSALLLEDVIPKIQKQAQELEEKLSRLETISEDLNIKKDKTLAASQDLEKEQKTLSKLVDQKTSLYKKTNIDLKAREQSVQQISLKAKNLNDLVNRLEQEERTRGQQQASFRKPTPLPSRGKTRYPMQGPVVVSYNQPDAFGAPSKGLSIQGRSGSLIVAPMGGVVQFAGHFKNYGNMVIIEHENKYHSLIAGFEKLDTLVGQSVSAGEPLGKLHQSVGGKKPKLYFELRHKGEAIDPAAALSNMS